jgi:uncharacterized damage-inducible protein DinB
MNLEKELAKAVTNEDYEKQPPNHNFTIQKELNHILT